MNDTKHIYGISTSQQHRSSGIQWFKCITMANDALSRITGFYVENIKSTRAQLIWTIPCNVTIELKQFIISHCEIEEEACIHMISQKIPYDDEKSTHNSILNDLKPFRKYRVSISMNDFKKSGPETNEFFQTDSGNPTAPLNLTATKIGNDSIQLSWIEPIEWNGIELGYEIYSNNSQPVFVAKLNKTSPTKWLLTKLESLTMYQIQMVAVNNNSVNFHRKSIVSNTIEVYTRSGNPYPPTNVESSQENGQIICEWEPSATHRRPITLYEVSTNLIIDGKIRRYLLGLVNKTKCTINKNPCLDGQPLVKFFIRSVNVDEGNNTTTHFEHYNSFYPSVRSNTFGCNEAIARNEIERIEYFCGRSFSCYTSNYIVSVVNCEYSLVSLITITGILVGAAICCFQLYKHRKIKPIEFDFIAPMDYFIPEKSEGNIYTFV